ncbi:restriction endonuclease subunit S [Candidatus Pelagibacter sp.]|nr:restriction endonuclease subunit S [Candidatus Pelagibacter sp.]
MKKFVLDDVCEIKGRIGFRGYSKKDIVDKGEGAISLSPSNIKDNKLNFLKNTYISWDKYNESPEIQVSIGDIVFCKTASVGKLAFVENLPEKSTLNPQLVVFKKIKCLKKYLFYYLNSDSFQYQLNSIISGSSIPTITQNKLGKLSIFLPSEKEQKKISTKLGHVEKMIFLRKKSIIKLNELKQSIFYDIFGDPINNSKKFKTKKIKNVCKLINGLAFKPNDWEDKGLPIIRIQNLNDHSKKFNYTNKKFDKKYYISKGDILFSWSGTPGTSFGCFIWDRNPGWLNQHIFKVELDKNILDPEFFKIQMNLKINILISKAQGGVGLKHVKKGTVEDLDLIIPQLYEQTKFSNMLKQISKNLSKYTSSLNHKERLFASLKSKYFT